MSSTSQHLRNLQSRHGIKVRVSRENGDQASCGPLIAVPAKSVAKIVGSDGSYTVVDVADWIVFAADWKSAVGGSPRKGDAISVESECDEYLVMHPDQATPVFANFNQLDRPAIAWRVHSTPR